MKPLAPEAPTPLRQAADLLASDPGEAARRAKAILLTAPRHPAATLILASARRRQGAFAEAHPLLAPLAEADPRNPLVQYELGESLAGLSATADAIAALRRAVAARPDMAIAWRALGDVLFLSGDRAAADEAYRRYVAAPTDEPAFASAAAALARGDAQAAEPPLRQHLTERPGDVRAMAMLASVVLNRQGFAEAEALLETALARHPGFVAARLGRAFVHLQLKRPVKTVIADLKQVLTVQPDNVNARVLLGGALARLGDAHGAVEAFQQALEARPNDPTALVQYGAQLKFVGRRDDAIAAFRRAIALDPRLGEAWFHLSDVKTYRFTGEEEAAMRALLAEDGLKSEQRCFAHYALARARADAGDPAQAFAQYAAGAALRRARTPYDAEKTTALVRRAQRLFTPAFFEARRKGGVNDCDPIFIVGLPRSGSTLVEQILASHSAVEGTTELTYINEAQRAAASIRGAPYPDLLALLDPMDRAELGRSYLGAARVHRHLGRPSFIDKTPENFQHVGLIHLILPRARIIDVRRHPIANGLSIFRQHFGEGRPYACDLREIGLFYRDYVDLMTCTDRALPARVHRVIYEDLVADAEGEIRRLLDYCGLSFEPACLSFHETRRAVMTPSAEQVRQPISTDGIDAWRAYEPWLGPLKEGLGPALELWRGDEETSGATTCPDHGVSTGTG
jgi:predicted Zn-dependent protease